MNEPLIKQLAIIKSKPCLGLGMPYVPNVCMCVWQHSYPSVCRRILTPNSLCLLLWQEVLWYITRLWLVVLLDSVQWGVWPYHVSFVILALVTIKLEEYINSRASPILVTTSGFIKARVLQKWREDKRNKEGKSNASGYERAISDITDNKQQTWHCTPYQKHLCITLCRIYKVFT